MKQPQTITEPNKKDEEIFPRLFCLKIFEEARHTGNHLPYHGKMPNRDSINAKVFGKGRMGFGEGREKLFIRKVLPTLPNAS
ncbi:hypothetical protein, partial [uncultured Bilophila sp.]|uniref:hypothetical protein n=1 Tax=uncultured Bilophila sp. TaxID=529385 RepID=UPI00280A9AAD